MTEWILIVMIASHSNGPVDFNSIRFHSQKSCVEAQKQFLVMKLPLRKVTAVCVEDDSTKTAEVKTNDITPSQQ